MLAAGPRAWQCAIFVAIGLVAAVAAGAKLAADEALTKEESNLAYCSVVLSHAAYGGERPGENDPASAGVLIARLAKLLKSTAAAIDKTVLQQSASDVAADITAKGRPRFSPTACAGYAHYISTTPLP